MKQLTVIITVLLIGFNTVFSQNDLTEETSSLFSGAGTCVECHVRDGNVMVENNVDVSPITLWRSTLMANAARDPLWRAKVSAEVEENPELESIIESKCTRCHAPMGNAQAFHDDEDNYSVAEMVDDPLAMDGVSCTLCHQILDDNFRNVESFSGGFEISEDRLMFGPYRSPVGRSMQMSVDYIPAYADYMDESELCATCHTLFTPYLDNNGEIAGEFPEQVPYLEWQNSVYIEEDISCQNCHMPRTEGGIVLSPRPRNLEPREPYWQHYFVGGNVLMLEMLRDNIDTLELTADEEEFNSTIDKTVANLQNEAVELTVSTELRDDSLDVIVHVTNQNVGHKLPTGIPIRRMWLHLTATDEYDEIIFESGSLDDDGEIIGLDSLYEPHHDFIDDQYQVQIYEAIMHDVNNDVTFTLLRASGFLKDNRLPPRGFVSDFESYEDMAIMGRAIDDPNFNRNGDEEGTGSDVVHYRIPAASSVEVELCYQSVMPRFIEHLLQFETEEVELFDEMYDEQDKDPVVIESVVVEVPNNIIDKWNETKPTNFILQPCFPNPFNSSTEIKFILSHPTQAELSITDLSGRTVNELYSGQTQTGTHRFSWDGTNSSGVTVSSGIYFVKLTTSSDFNLRKVVFLR